ncbi:hypothetical protein OPV22_021912 [Ensete ventricosum]|uniref:Uncharacterized protein n=1 Tax=Ensete ventricosum TaxID=4639 RepID=A0AAV8QK18_ENSVE|nr:hypothetical protein OPV22_021912 [Ensete ventricosum]
MAHYLRPVQMILWAANPPGSRAFTYLSRFRPSRSSPDTAAPPPTAAAAAKEEETTIAKGGFTRSDEAVRGHRIRKKHKVLGLEETLEEKATSDTYHSFLLPRSLILIPPFATLHFASVSLCICIRIDANIRLCRAKATYANALYLCWC